MASSRFESVPTIVEYLRNVKPNSVLDVGVGFGKIGLLIREYLEAWNDRVVPKDWAIHIDGIEIFHDYHKNSFQHTIYNNIIYGNCVEIIPTLIKKYDLLVCVDMIEHLEKSDATELLSEFKHHSKNILLSIPLGERWLRKSYGQNKYEAHISWWSEMELKNLGYKTLLKYEIPDGRGMGIFTYGK